MLLCSETEKQKRQQSTVGADIAQNEKIQLSPLGVLGVRFYIQNPCQKEAQFDQRVSTGVAVGRRIAD
jgi:hypothetical protein